MAQATSHGWRFFRAGGVDQVMLRNGADLASLHHLDQKLWMALAMPTRGLQFDPRTADLLDTDKDGRIRPPEVLGALAWAEAALVSLDDLLKGGDGGRDERGAGARAGADERAGGTGGGRHARDARPGGGAACGVCPDRDGLVTLSFRGLRHCRALTDAGPPARRSREFMTNPWHCPGLPGAFVTISCYNCDTGSLRCDPSAERTGESRPARSGYRSPPRLVPARRLPFGAPLPNRGERGVVLSAA